MSGFDVNFEGSAGPRSESEVMLLSTADKLQNAETSILASLSDKHRLTKAGINFDKLSMIEMKQFYNEAVDHMSSCTSGNLSASEAARRFAMLYNINIPYCVRAKIRVAVCSRLKSSKAMDEFVADLPFEADVDTATANNGHAARGANHVEGPQPELHSARRGHR
jgi:hypothetical protein